MRTTPLYYRVDRRQISFVRFILEAYEGLAVMSTVDADLGQIEILTAPGCEPMVQAIMADLGRQVMIAPQPADQGAGGQHPG